MIRKFLKLFALLCITIGAFSTVVNAQNGDVVGAAYYTDIVAYVNKYPIHSYAANGTSIVVAEDLSRYGFDVSWNGEKRTLNISKNNGTKIEFSTFSKVKNPGEKFADIISSDIKVYVEDKLVSCYFINGSTLIPIEALDFLGKCVWDSEKRTISLSTYVTKVSENTTSSNADATEIPESASYANPRIATGANLIPNENTVISQASTPVDHISAPRYSGTGYGAVSGTITYQYNDFVGTKGDVGAKVLLVQTNHTPYYQDKNTLSSFSGRYDDLVYSSKADGYGSYTISNVPAGEYFILVLSSKTNMSKVDVEAFILDAEQNLKYKFSGESYESLRQYIRFNSFCMDVIYVGSGQTCTYSHDFGYTYY